MGLNRSRLKIFEAETPQEFDSGPNLDAFPGWQISGNIEIEDAAVAYG